MSKAGKYVRVRPAIVCSEDDEIRDTANIGKYVLAPSSFGMDLEHRADENLAVDNSGASNIDDDSDNEDSQYDHYRVESDPDREKEALWQRIAEMEKTIAELSSTKSNRRSQQSAVAQPPNEAQGSWNCFSEASSSQAEKYVTNIRWDQIKPFPKGVPAHKLWEEWSKYIEKFEIAASLSSAIDPARRAKLLFLSMGEELQAIVQAANLRPNLNEKNCYTTFTENIEQHLRSMTDPTAEHEAFSRMQQEVGESVVCFHARLVEKVRLCGYSPCNQELFVRGQLLTGLLDRQLARHARTLAYDANEIVQYASRDEAFQAETNRSTNTHSPTINRVQFTKPFLKRESRNDQPSGTGNKQPRINRFASLSRRERCSKCNFSFHRNGKCPAEKLSCHLCGRIGHFKSACRRRRVNVVQDQSPGTTDQEQHVETKVEELNALSLTDVLVDCRLGSSSPLQFLIDSGADVNVVGGSDWCHLEQEFQSGKADLELIKNTSGRKLLAYATSAPMKVDLAFRAKVKSELSTKTVSADFLVVKDGKRSLLGRSTANDLQLLFVGHQVNHCDEARSGIFPKVPGVKIKFSVDKSIPPVRQAYYNIPAAYREGARQRLQEMEASGIIERVTKAPEWISGMSAVAKGKNDFRLVVNMRAPNTAIKREYFRLPLIDEIKVKLNGAKFFTKLDLKNAFYHLELSHESRDLTTFLAESGMFRFTRLMFGVNCAPEIFQREMCRILDKVEKKIVYIDDVLLYAETLEELHKTVAQVLQILRSNHLTLNPAKCEFDKTELTYLGNKLDQYGFHIEEAKIAAIRSFRRPSTKSELRSFLGLASFISPYIANFAEISNPLWAATGTKAWIWEDQHERAFIELKNRIIHCTTSLGYFSEQDETILYTDASPNTLGAVLIQETVGKPPRIISFASKALTATEKGYGQNQREALGVVWAVEHFSFFLLGRQFTLRTDAQGVTFIFNRTREDSKQALNRADGWALRLSPYNYRIEYVKGRDNIADPPSRLYQGIDGPFDEDSTPWEIANLEANAVIFLTEDEIRVATEKDNLLQQVIDALQSNSWTKNLSRFHAVSSDLSVNDGLLIKLGCVVVPEILRHKALEVAHSGHPLSAKLKSILRERVWWPGMAKDAEEWVKSCKVCAMNGRPEKPSPMQRVFAPKTVWETVAVDFNGPYAKYGGISILVIIDYRSRFAIARPVKSTSFENTKKVLDEVFDREGLPKAIKSDNGPPFNGAEYKNYCNERGIQTIFSTPFYPQQNGLVENFMKTVNKAMSAASSSGNNFNEELQAAVHAHNTAAHSITKMSPEEVMVGRKVQRGLPLINRGKASIDDARDTEAKLYSKAHGDAKRSARPCKVQPGETVIVERHTKAKGEARFDSRRYTVVKNSNGSLVLSDENGQLLKRHVSQVKKVHEWRGMANSDLPGSASRSAVQVRPSREKRAPAHLSDYVHLTEETE